jgi:hypothetical protein
MGLRLICGRMFGISVRYVRAGSSWSPRLFSRFGGEIDRVDRGTLRCSRFERSRHRSPPHPHVPSRARKEQKCRTGVLRGQLVKWRGRLRSAGLAFGAELAPAQAVQMEVVHCHSRGRPHVEGEPVTALSDAFFLGYLGRCRKHARDERAMLASNVAGVGDMFLREDYEVDRRARVDVQDHDDEVILVQPVRRDLALDYLAENAVGHRLG